MNDLDRLQKILPFAVALYLATSLAQLQATQATAPHAGSAVSVERVAASVKWHMLQIARNEQNEALVFPGN
ncbi:hypothetical protein U8607_14990 [Methylobacterium durans]|uniref:hypothetical protein n=1 Tax=Methylobacterium durans TaxID=2202825 RepID=UPI002B0034C9|nr:hypothetical protein [Methylobacterium durans]MEA1833389.1 hypothetical protein [Methylobacterium durans]